MHVLTEYISLTLRDWANIAIAFKLKVSYCLSIGKLNLMLAHSEGERPSSCPIWLSLIWKRSRALFLLYVSVHVSLSLYHTCERFLWKFRVRVSFQRSILGSYTWVLTLNLFNLLHIHKLHKLLMLSGATCSELLHAMFNGFRRLACVRYIWTSAGCRSSLQPDDVYDVTCFHAVSSISKIARRTCDASVKLAQVQSVVSHANVLHILFAQTGIHLLACDDILIA